MRSRIKSFISAFLIAVFAFSYIPGCSVNPFTNKMIDIEAESEAVYQEYLTSIADRMNELSSGSITIGNITMKHSFSRIGEPDKDGYPLYIALRGGGVNDTDMAREQYEYMKTGYKSSIKSGIYVVPQGFYATWDEHYRPESFQFYDRIIEDAIAFHNADPNRVYFIGFSSGGDGVYQIAPRIADRLAAANMSSGYPHELRVENLYNLPFCIQVGELDTAYDRCYAAADFDSLLNEAAKNYGGGFTHFTFIHCGGTHNQYWTDIWNDQQSVYTGDQVAEWLKDPSKATMKNVNTGAVDMLKKYTRDPYPQKVVWNTDVSAGLRDSQAFYWLDRDGGLKHSLIVASYSKESNSVTVEQCDAKNGTLKVYLKPQMLDVFSKVTVNVCGKNYTVRPIVSRQIMENTLRARGDRNYMFTSEIDISFDGDGNVVQVKAAGNNVTDYSLPEELPLYSWNKDGLFFVDESLFGLSFDELEEKTGLDLPAVKKWDYGGYDLKWTSYTESNGQSLIFLFQKNKCVIIYSEKTGKPGQALLESSKVNLGEFSNGILCRHYISDNPYDGLSHVKQEYIWYEYEESAGLFKSIAL